MSLQDNPPVTKCPGPSPYLSPPPCILLLAICRSTDQTALSHGECEWLMEYGWWRSGLAPFNTASTSNNSRLWQLCIIHLVESLSPFPPWRFSLPLLFQFLFSSSSYFFFFLPPGTWRRGEGEPGQCSIRCCLFPPDTSDFGDTEVFVCSTLPRLWILDAIWTRLCSFFIEALCLIPLLQTWIVELLPKNT